LFDRLISVLVDVTADYLDMQIAAGAEAVQLFDTWAGMSSLPHSTTRGRWRRAIRMY
jgi:uroporphyrinogen decarboxylase